MKNNPKGEKPNSEKPRKVRLIIIALLGLLSGAGIIRYCEIITVSSMASVNYTNLLWLTILFSICIWILLRIILRSPAVISLSILYFLGSTILWLYYAMEPVAMVDIINRDDNTIAPFVFAGLLLAIMSLIDYFFFSQHTSKFISITIFYYLLFVMVIPVIMPEVFSTRAQAFWMSIVVVLVLSAGWIILGETLLLIVGECFRKIRYYE